MAADRDAQREVATMRTATVTLRMEPALLGELVLLEDEYPRRSLNRTWVEELAAMAKQGVRWHTPLVVDRGRHLLDGWHRYHALWAVYGNASPLLEVEVEVDPCEPHERLFRAAEINRLHGRRLADDDAARVVARCALALAPGGERAVKRAARRLALRLAVDWTLVVRELFPEASKSSSKVRKLSSRPAVIYDRSEFTVTAVAEHCRWLAEALALAGQGAVQDPEARRTMERAYAALHYLLEVKAKAGRRHDDAKP
jgi:hypothetical protein